MKYETNYKFAKVEDDPVEILPILLVEWNWPNKQKFQAPIEFRSGNRIGVRNSSEVSH